MTTPMNVKEKLCKDDGADKVDEAIYRSLIGCLMYLIATRPNIMHVVSLLSRFMHCASEVHFKAAKRVVRYIKGTLCYDIQFSCIENFDLQGYADSDWASSCDDMKSTSGYYFNFGSRIFSWCSKKRDNCSINSRGRVCCSYCSCKSSFMAEKNLSKFGHGAEESY